MKERDETALWREAFATTSPADRPSPDCPPAERIWDAARNEATPAELRQLLAHVATCPVCTEAWRLAKEVEEAGKAREYEQPRGQPKKQWLAAAALFAVVIGGFVIRDAMVPEPVVRSADRETLQLLSSGDSLPRDRCLLRWTELEDAIYDVSIRTEDLDPISEASGLEEPEYLVPEEDLARAPEGESLSILVEARCLSEGTIASRTFSFRCV